MTSSIGGIDLVLEASREEFDSRHLLEPLLDRWPDALFQDANEGALHPLQDLLTVEKKINSREFFVYRDRPSALAWERGGQSQASSNRMVHFLILDGPSTEGPLQITLVIDDLTSEMADLYVALSDHLDQLRQQANGAPKGRHPTIESELQSAGYNSSRTTFYNLVDEVREALFPAWTLGELAYHPKNALQLCDAVRLKAKAPVPDHLIMKAALSRRHQK